MAKNPDVKSRHYYSSEQREEVGQKLTDEGFNDFDWDDFVSLSQVYEKLLLDQNLSDGIISFIESELLYMWKFLANEGDQLPIKRKFFEVFTGLDQGSIKWNNKYSLRLVLLMLENSDYDNFLGASDFVYSQLALLLKPSDFEIL